MGGANDARKATIWDIADSSSVSITGTQASPEAGKSSELIKKAAFKSIENLRHTRVRSNLIRTSGCWNPSILQRRRSHETWILHSPRRIAPIKRNRRNVQCETQGYDSTFLSHSAAGRDGLTCHQRLHARWSKSEIVNFLTAGGAYAKHHYRWVQGVWLGRTDETVRNITGPPGGRGRRLEV